MKKILLTVIGLMAVACANAGQWKESYQSDEMRGTSRKFVENSSVNSVDFEFPYNGGSSMSLVLRSNNTELKNNEKAEELPLSEAMLIISKGQFTCDSYNDCSISVKFDDEKIQRYSMSRSSSGSSDVMFIDDSRQFIKNIKSHNKLIIEAQFYRAGAKQFKFDLTGLK